jgi:hypothetical protein
MGGLPGCAVAEAGAFCSFILDKAYQFRFGQNVLWLTMSTNFCQKIYSLPVAVTQYHCFVVYCCSGDSLRTTFASVMKTHEFGSAVRLPSSDLFLIKPVPSAACRQYWYSFKEGILRLVRSLEIGRRLLHTVRTTVDLLPVVSTTRLCPTAPSRLFQPFAKAKARTV